MERHELVKTILNGPATKVDLIAIWERKAKQPQQMEQLRTLLVRRWSFRAHKYGADSARIENVRVPIENADELGKKLIELHTDYLKAKELHDAQLAQDDLDRPAPAPTPVNHPPQTAEQPTKQVA